MKLIEMYTKILQKSSVCMTHLELDSPLPQETGLPNLAICVTRCDKTFKDAYKLCTLNDLRKKIRQKSGE